MKVVALALVALAGLLSACDSSTDPGVLASIVVTPNTTLSISTTQQFVAVGSDIDGNEVEITPTWSVESGGGTISADGLFTAGTVPGAFAGTIKATSGTISGTASVTVIGGPAESIALTPTNVILLANGTQQYTAVAVDAGGNVVPITPTWSVVANGGSINSTGFFTAGTTPGTFSNTVRASIECSTGAQCVAGFMTRTATVNVSAGSSPAPVALGTAGNFVILAKSAISNVPTSAITGDLGLSPAAASFITGFSLSLPAGGASATSSQVTGNVYATDYAAPTPTNLTTAISNMETAYTDAAGRTLPDFTELGSGNIGGLTLPPGLYKWSNTVTIPTNVTLSGGVNDVWIFQIAGGINQSAATRVQLAGGARAQNIFWQVAGVVEIGTTAHMEGVILSQTSITLNTGATAKGRLLAQTAVTLAGNTVVQ